VIGTTCLLADDGELTLGFHVLDPGVTRIQNGRKPIARGSVSVSATVLNPPSVTVEAVTVRIARRSTSTDYCAS
jgi:hypothetical protein